MIFERKELLRFYKMMDGRIKRFVDYDGSPCFLLRHDIDYSLEAAYSLAVFEKEHDIPSTFFIQLRGPYNPLSKLNSVLIEGIIDMGFEIGIHFDPTLYKDNLDSRLYDEIYTFETFFGMDIHSVSLHNPSIHGTYPMFDGCVNTYSTELFEPDRYLSDSLRNFRGKNPFEFIDTLKDKPLQVVLHPIYYME